MPARSPIELAGDHFASSLQECFRERARSGPDFEHQVARAHPGGLEQPAQLILVVQEILSE